MKRYITAMGISKPAEIIPDHPEYHPSIFKLLFKRILDIANKSNNQLLIDGLAKLVIDDVNSDIKAAYVDFDKIVEYYSTYYNYLTHGVKVSTDLLSNLNNIFMA